MHLVVGEATEGATVIQHSLYVRLPSGYEGLCECLVLVKASLLEVYRIQDDGQLRLQSRQSLPTAPVQVAALNRLIDENDSNCGDQIILEFGLDQPRFSILTYDPLLLAFRTASLHAYGDRLLTESHQQSMAVPKKTKRDQRSEAPISAGSIIQTFARQICADPMGRLVLMRIDRDSFALLLPQGRREDDVDADISQSSIHTFASAVDGERLGAGTVLALEFLQGYTKPTLAILYSPHPRTFPNRPLDETNTEDRRSLALLIASFDRKRRSFPTLIHHQAGLPPDLERLHALPGGGVLISGASNLIFAEPGQSMAVGLALNEHYQQPPQTKSKQGWTRSPQAPPGVTMGLADQVLVLSAGKNPRILLTTGHGCHTGSCWWILHLQRLGGGRAVSALELTPIVDPPSWVPSCGCVCNISNSSSPSVFMASSMGEAGLLSIKEVNSLEESIFSLHFLSKLNLAGSVRDWTVGLLNPVIGDA